MVSLTAVCASWNPWPVPLGGKSEWPAEDRVTDVGSAGLDPCARWRLDAVCAPLSVWSQPSPYVALTDTHMLVNVSCMSTPVHTRSAYTWPQPDTARPVEKQFVPLGLCAQLDSVYVPVVSTPHLALCAAVMASPTSVPVSSERLPVSSRYKLRRPVQGRVSRLSVAQGALGLGKTMRVSRSCVGSMVVSGMRTQKTGRVSVTLVARVSLKAQCVAQMESPTARSAI